MRDLSQISYRLGRVREREGLSLREFVEVIEDRTGFRIGHDSARRYETDRTRVPAEYVAEVCRAFGVASDWLLFGEGPIERPPTPVVERAFQEVTRIVRQVRGLRSVAPQRRVLEMVRREWEFFVEGLPPRHHLREAIIESWDRSRNAGVVADDEESRLRRVPREDLARRLRAHGDLVDAAERHLAWLSTAATDLPHVAYVVCRDGIVLHAETPEPQLLDQWGLEPGHDWSEEAMGTNGAGTALASDSTVAVIGPEHYVRAVQGCTCVAAPVHDPDGEIVGAIDLSTSFAGWRPHRLVYVAYAAAMIERELGRRRGGSGLAGAARA